MKHPAKSDICWTLGTVIFFSEPITAVAIESIFRIGPSYIGQYLGSMSWYTAREVVISDLCSSWLLTTTIGGMARRDGTKRRQVGGKKERQQSSDEQESVILCRLILILTSPSRGSGLVTAADMTGITICLFLGLWFVLLKDFLLLPIVY